MRLLAWSSFVFLASSEFGVDTVEFLGISGRDGTPSIDGGNGKYNGAVLAANGVIYGIPCNAVDVLRIHTMDDKVTLLSARGSTNADRKWSSAVLSPDGSIYAIPDAATIFLQISPGADNSTNGTTGMDTDNAVTHELQRDSTVSWHPWRDTLVANNTIYGIPYNSPSVLRINPWTQEATTFGNLGEPWSYLWSTSVLASNGAIYGIPSYSLNVLKIDPAHDSVITFGNITGRRASRWYGGVISLNGLIYGIPYTSSRVLSIDPGDDSMMTFGDVGRDETKWKTGVLATNGIIYGIPYTAMAVLRIDPVGNSVSTFGSLSGRNAKWHYGVFSDINGCVYGIPSSANNILRIDTRNDSIQLIGNMGDQLGRDPVADKWSGVVTTPAGVIYAVPHNAASVLKFTPGVRTTTSTQTTTYSYILPTGTSTTTPNATITTTTTTTEVIEPEFPVAVFVASVFGGLLLVAGITALSVLCCRPKPGPVVVVIDEKKPVFVLVSGGDGKKALQKWDVPQEECQVSIEKQDVPLVKQSPKISRSKVAPAPTPQILEVQPKPLPKVLCGRFNSDPELEIEVMPPTAWIGVQPPTRSCKDELAMNRKIISVVSDVGRVINDVSMKVFELQYAALPVWLDHDCKFAIAAYTHDLKNGDKRGNLYFELNRQLQLRSFLAQKDTREAWGIFMHYFMVGLSQLNDWHGECFRGCSARSVVVGQYEHGTQVQWGTFCSASSSVDVAKSVINEFPRDETVIFRLTVKSGRDIQAYSFFPLDGEVLLTPNHRFTVCSKPYELEGYLFIDLEEVDGDAFNV